MRTEASLKGTSVIPPRMAPYIHATEVTESSRTGGGNFGHVHLLRAIRHAAATVTQAMGSLTSTDLH
jgi:hypothetical protein